VAQDSLQMLALVESLMSLRIPYNAGVSGLVENTSASEQGLLLHGGSYSVTRGL
jgi:hypothetical protein